MQELVYSSRGLTQTIERAMGRRQTGRNYFNNSSSRSHCFLTMRLSKVVSRVVKPTAGATAEDQSSRRSTVQVAALVAYLKLPTSPPRSLP